MALNGRTLSTAVFSSPAHGFGNADAAHRVRIIEWSVVDIKSNLVAVFFLAR
jgi:hypothetical protein